MIWSQNIPEMAQMVVVVVGDDDVCDVRETAIQEVLYLLPTPEAKCVDVT